MMHPTEAMFLNIVGYEVAEKIHDCRFGVIDKVQLLKFIESYAGQLQKQRLLTKELMMMIKTKVVQHIE